ncbi:MAG: NAD(P)-binding protein [Candidatus Latescibacteria bacterium]|nr:NAD(P)-binding protein [Candidatus Latescibacterota bacterium]NIM21165.1 NAD(P)-binding protein [Candidatus Latescibacterota bacterium]NIM65300.1 NAD(P)-binding protein [Candidatus Latescibacterota bacterium]NIO01815.1 NAD(P)-binding protein [Candidatus Latescibacterota bacterium]NIO28332.1 NAD(P)-binding protein [Candidatus Latescibacterota bacterium]
MLDKSFDLTLERREFLKVVLGGLAMTALDWSAFPRGPKASSDEHDCDAVIIGSGLGGLSCAAAFARQGLKPLVLEKHDRPGGYATAFKRPGGFEFDVSLHSTTVEEREGVHDLIPGFPEIKDVDFVPHPQLYRAIFPDYDYRVPQKNISAYIDILGGFFPDERTGIQGLFDDMKSFTNDLNSFVQMQGQIDMSQIPVKFPNLVKYSFQTWSQIMDPFIKNPKLKALISSLWGYYGLPPSKLASIYYAMPTLGYLEHGGYYPIGRSQKISDAFVKFIEGRGGKVLLKSKVKEILVKDHTAYGVKTESGKTYTGKVVVSNANAYDTFRTMMGEDEYLKDYLARLDSYSVSLSCFQVFLGLKKDLVSELGIEDTEIFCETGYDMDAAYEGIRNADVESGGFGVMLYDNLYDGYSPRGKNTLNILTLQGFDHWKQYEEDYWKGSKAAYKKEKERMADILIQKVEEKLLPDLSDAIEVKEIGTPLTNLRYTGNYRGAMYGFDQTLSNSGQTRLEHQTPIKNLYLSGAWTRPGHGYGYGGVFYSGLECFGEIMKEW